MKLIAFIILIFCLSDLNAQVPDYRNQEYDITKYSLYAKLDPDTAHVFIKAVLSITVKTDIETLYLDLKSLDKKNKGMIVDYIVDTKYQDTLNFEHVNNELRVRSIRFKKNYSTRLLVVYSGSPADGLIFGRNRFGDKTVFADNWPNRGHNWLVSNDHPSDKALWDIMVEVPKKYQVISNGTQLANEIYEEDFRRVIYETKVEIPTKVMVIGVAEFEIDNYENTSGVPMSSWVFPQNKDKGFKDYKPSAKVLDWFISKIDSFPYSKLANVQSKTIFGGMENASCIFYFEGSVNGLTNHVDLIAHEIAHQWFGNSASELDWPHLWLSEGFATYLTDLYILETEGEEAFQKRMKKERNQVLRFYNNSEQPVVYRTDELMKMLNANSYQKGAWILHMLRNKVGEEMFWKILKDYYKAFKFSNATTEDFFQVAQFTSGMHLEKFMGDWLFESEIPELCIKSKLEGKKVKVEIEQQQTNKMEFSIEFELIGKKKSKVVRSEIKDGVSNLVFEADFKIIKIKIDPQVKLLSKIVCNEVR